MKLRLFVLLFLCGLCWAQSPITITGTVVDSSNNVATGGYVQFSLSPLNQGLAYQVPPSTIIASVSKCGINALGQLVNFTTGIGTCLVWPNDIIQPSNTLYTVTIAPNNTVTRVYNNVLLKSTVNPQSLAQLTFISPQPVVGTVIGGSPLVTMSVIPNQDLVWTLGDPTHRYAHVYANVLDDVLTNLTVTNLHVEGYIDNDLFGQPLLLQDDVHITGTATLDGCVVFNTGGGNTTTLCPSGGGTYSQTLPAVTSGIAPLVSPAFTGVPTAPTPAAASNDNTVATTAFVKTFIAPASPVTSVFGRIGAITAQAGDYNVAQVTGAAPLASPTFTGTPAASTAAPGTNTTQLATTAFVQAATTTPCSGCGAPQRVALSSPVSLSSNVVTTVLTKSVTFPSATATYRADVRYGVWLDGANSCAAEVIDTTNNHAYALDFSDSNGGGGHNGLAASEVSNFTYSPSAVVSFSLKVVCNGGETATVNSSLFTFSPAEASYLEITPTLSN